MYGWPTLVESWTLASEASALLASAGQASQLTMLVDGVCDPLQAGIITDSIVCGINHNDLEEFVGRVLIDPVRIEDAEAGHGAARPLFSDGTVRTLILELINTLMDGLPINSALRDGAFTSTTTDADAVNKDALLGLESKHASFVRARWASDTDNSSLLAIFPAADTKHKAHGIRLLLPPNL